LNAEMDHHLAGEDPDNRPNGNGKKTVVTDTGQIEPASFDSRLIAKYQRRFPGFENSAAGWWLDCRARAKTSRTTATGAVDSLSQGDNVSTSYFIGIYGVAHKKRICRRCRVCTGWPDGSGGPRWHCTFSCRRAGTTAGRRHPRIPRRRCTGNQTHPPVPQSEGIAPLIETSRLRWRRPPRCPRWPASVGSGSR
jgi:hypothetical protein